MVFIYRKVRVNDGADAEHLAGRLNAHLVTDFTLRMSDPDSVDFRRRLGKGQVDEIYENPANAYELRILYRKDNIRNP